MSQVVRQERPLNTEPRSARLTESFITPNELVFNRNHDSAVPLSGDDASSPHASTEPRDWTLTISAERIEGPETASLQRSQRMLSLEQLQRDYAHAEVVATLECAGNRRSELAASHPQPEGIPWGNAVIANVVWGGAEIRAVLLAAGIVDPFAHHTQQELAELAPSEETSLEADDWSRSLHVHLLSAQQSKDGTREERFAASIPLTTAMHPNQSCLLAYAYNGQPLTQVHGAPLRAVVPGHVGARWVKWLTALKICTYPNESPPMRDDYKLLIPRTIDEADYARNAKNPEFRSEELQRQQPIQRLETSCAITHPHDKTSLEPGTTKVTVKGYAVGQDGSPADRVWIALVPEPERETDNEHLLRSLPHDVRWHQAEIRKADLAQQASRWSWAWSLWSLDLQLPRDSHSYAIIARCSTAAGVEQPMISPWNLRGFCNRSWSVIRHISASPHTPST